MNNGEDNRKDRLTSLIQLLVRVGPFLDSNFVFLALRVTEADLEAIPALKILIGSASKLTNFNISRLGCF